jgi:Flavin containing amine oxidoreductase
LLRDGYGSVAQELASKVKIKYDFQVERVAYNDEGVRIVSTDGEEVRADVGVITLPLGVLKSGYVHVHSLLLSSHVTCCGLDSSVHSSYACGAHSIYSLCVCVFLSMCVCLRSLPP